MIPKGRTKDTLSITIEKEILKKFNNYSDKNAINKSKSIEKLFLDFIEEIE